MSDLLRMTLVDLVATLRAKKASPVELMRDVFAAVDRNNPLLNAVVAERDRSVLMDEARAAEGRIVRGEARTLEGIPLGVKDLEDAAGLVTSYGAKPFRDNVAKHDSTQVARLKAAGAIVFGKTNAPEFGSTAITKNLLFGTTRSPWDLERTPGGSSGGSAAALASGTLPLVTASDGGGSVRIPASFVGAFGLKPSFGRIPLSPLDEWQSRDTTVHGPLTKTVEDAALFLDLVAGQDPYDPHTLPHPGFSYVERLKEPLPSKLKIAYLPDFGYAVVQSDIAAAVEGCAKTFEKLGHSVQTISGGPPNMGGDWGILGAYEIGAFIAHLRPDHDADFPRGLMEVVRFSEGMTHHLWAQISQRRVALVNFFAELFSRFDLLLTPTVPYDPPPAKGPFPETTEGRRQPTAGVAAFTIPFNLAWQPAGTVRVGLSNAGLPMGMQIVAPHHRDELVLQAALAFERERPWHPTWPRSVAI